MYDRTMTLDCRVVDVKGCSRSPQKSEFSYIPFRSETLQVQARLLGRHHQRKRRGVRRDDHILGESAFEPQAGHAKSAVLIIEMCIDRVVAGFRNAPRYAAQPPIFDLTGHSRPAGPVEQRVLVGRHHQKRHEVLEHRAAPRKKDRPSTGQGEQAAQGKPALLRELPLRNTYETAEPRFRSQQVVITRVPPSAVDVVSDGQ